MSERRRHDVDTAIDRAVREIMGVDTDATFRARVLGKLQAPARREASWLRLGALLAAAAAVVLAVLLMRDTPQAPGPLAGSDPAAQPAPAAAPAPPRQTAAIPRQETAPATPRQPLPRRRTAPPPNVTQEVRAGALIATVADVEAGFDTPPLESPEPIAMPPLTPLAPLPILIEPLAPIQPIQIVPLFMPRPPQRK